MMSVKVIAALLLCLLVVVETTGEIVKDDHVDTESRLLSPSFSCQALKHDYQMCLQSHGGKKKKKGKAEAGESSDLLCALLQVQIQSACTPDACFSSDETTALALAEDSLMSIDSIGPATMLGFDSCSKSVSRQDSDNIKNQIQNVAGPVGRCFSSNPPAPTFASKSVLQQHDSDNIGVCFDEHFCTYALEDLCTGEGKTFSSTGSCRSFGFDRFLQYYATGDIYGYSEPSATCVRESTNQGFDEATSNFCHQNRPPKIPTNAKSSICACGFEEPELGGEEGGMTSCASRGLPHHVKIPNSNGQDINACMMLAPTVEAVACTKTAAPPKWECGQSCQLSNLFRNVALGCVTVFFNNVLKATPAGPIGPVISGIVGFLWPPSGPDINGIIKELVEYVDARILEAEAATILTVVDSHLDNIQEHGKQLILLEDSTETAYTAMFRSQSFAAVNDHCLTLKSLLVEIGQGLSDAVSDTKRLPYISTVGQTCISFLSVAAYNSKQALGQSSPEFELIYTSLLEDTIQAFTNMSLATNQKALDWRLKGIQVKKRSGYDYYRVYDFRCPSVYGPTPEHKGYVAAARNKEGAEYLKEIYSTLMKDAFKDGLLRAWDSNIPVLWKYYRSHEVQTNTKPQPVMRIATSPIGFSWRPRCEEWEYELCTRSKIFFDQESYDQTRNGSFQRDFALTRVIIYFEKYEPLLFTHGLEMNGPEGYNRTLGCKVDGARPCSFGIKHQIFDLASNERITAMYEKRDFFEDDTLTIAFQTSYVNETGAFESHGRTLIPDDWKDCDLPEENWYRAPTVATFKNTSFMPHIISVVGWIGDTEPTIPMTVPLWLYEIDV